MDRNSEVELENPSVNRIVSIVKQYVDSYEIEVSPLSIRFKFLDSDNPDISKKFSELNRALMEEGYIAQLVKDYEYYIVVSRMPQRKFTSIKVNIILLILTILSTLYAGYLFSEDFVPKGPYLFLRTLMYSALFFSAPLLTILGVHELGHYFVAKHYGVRASLPFFIPFIPLAYSIGTFGAFISLRDPFPNRKVMANIGAAGPIAGFLTALPLLFVADYLQKTMIHVKNFSPYFLHYPLIYNLLDLLPVKLPVFPMVLSVWVGIFATAMNLIPVGQLDGGHVLRGIVGRKSIIISYGFLLLLFYLGLNYFGWILIAILVMFLGLEHPPALDDSTPVGMKEIAIGIAVLVMFILSFTPVPFYI
ncbi:site-2 protease family protein [Cuniculiplasma sp. SKW4]|uniref:site-2 protease family protein n=1 Tax=Cuniculiplasma sp. SKW4 TaxID=3400171 RepID=UPI003FD088E0